MSDANGELPKGGENKKLLPKSHDELWGRLVITVLLLGLLTMLGFFALIGYRIYDERNEKEASITALPKSEAMAEPGMDSDKSDGDRSATEAEKSAERISAPADAKQTDIAILNAGGGSGVAGQLATSLKEAGYAKTTAGNSSGSYAGVTVYYKEGQEAAAKTILVEVVKKYPKATVAPADPKKADTMGSAVVVIIGAGS